MQQHDIEHIINSIDDQGSSPPVHLWNPELSGTIDIVIKRDGSWIHEGSAIKRPSLVKLFSSILKREGDDYFLVTPAEKWQLQVDDLPFFIPVISFSEDKEPVVIRAITNTEQAIEVGTEHPLQITLDDSGQPLPQILVRDNLWARLSRPAFYELVDNGIEKTATLGKELMVYSNGVGFSLGRLEIA